MLDIKLIRENPDEVKVGIEKKGFDPQLIDEVLRLDEKKREAQTKVEQLRAERNSFKEFNDSVKERAVQIKNELEVLEGSLSVLEGELNQIMASLPNIPFDDVPVGPDESGNCVVWQWGNAPEFKFEPKDHVELGKNLDIIDTEKASQVSGARFAYLKGKLALLEFAIVQYTLQVLSNEEILKEIAEEEKLDVPNKPFMAVVPPVFIRPEVMQKMARLEPKEERYHIPSDDLYLIGSAEHTLGPIHMDEILDENELPLRYAGFSTSFRREAGSYGKDMKGILRLHQFDKIEMESFTLAQDSRKEQDFIVAIQEYLLKSLKLPYQVVSICTGDMGGPDARQIDIETWMPGQNKYRETHTSDLMTDYQARRLNTRVKRHSGEIEFVHTNDATSFAIGRILIAIMENYQNEDGTITIPDVLIPYVGFNKIG